MHNWPKAWRNSPRSPSDESGNSDPQPARDSRISPGRCTAQPVFVGREPRGVQPPRVDGPGAIERGRGLSRGLSDGAGADGDARSGHSTARFAPTTCGSIRRARSSCCSFRSSWRFAIPCRSKRGLADYLAPEVEAAGEANEQADIYALGCTIFEMVAGRPLFPGGDAWQKRAARSGDSATARSSGGRRATAVGEARGRDDRQGDATPLSNGQGGGATVGVAGGWRRGRGGGAAAAGANDRQQAQESNRGQDPGYNAQRPAEQEQVAAPVEEVATLGRSMSRWRRRKRRKLMSRRKRLGCRSIRPLRSATRPPVRPQKKRGVVLDVDRGRPWADGVGGQ